MAGKKPGPTRRVSFEARWTEELPAETAFEEGDALVLDGVELTVARVQVWRGVTWGKDADAVYVQLMDSPPRSPTSRGFDALRAREPGAEDPFAAEPVHEPDPSHYGEYGMGSGRKQVKFGVTMTEWLLPEDIPQEGDRIQIEGRWFEVHRSFVVTKRHKASPHSIYDVFDYQQVNLVQETAHTRLRGEDGGTVED